MSLTLSTCFECQKEYDPHRNATEADAPGLCGSCYVVAKRENDIKAKMPEMRDLCDKLRHIDTEVEKTAFVRALMSEHRTCQQLIFGVMLASINKWAEVGANGPGHYDARNEATIKACLYITEHLPSRLLHLPYI